MKYFPDETGYLLRAQEWICNTIQYGGTGISPVVERQIWDRERSRTLSELNRNEAEAYTLWAGRGFPLPPGMLANQLSMICLDAAGKIAQASRDMAIKQMEIEIENVKFAVSEAIKLYGSAVGAAGDYLKALSIGPTSAMQVIPSITDSQSRLISAATDSYRASISVDELRLKASMTPAQWEQEAHIKNGDWLTQQIKIEVDAAIAAAQSVGTQAAAALNGLHANTGVTNNTQDSVSYNYSNDTLDAAPTIVTVVDTIDETEDTPMKRKCGIRRAFTYGGIPSALLDQMDKEAEYRRNVGIQDQFRADRQKPFRRRRILSPE